MPKNKQSISVYDLEHKIYYYILNELIKLNTKITNAFQSNYYEVLCVLR